MYARRRSHCVTFTIALVALVPGLRAHDSWIEPDAFAPSSGTIVRLRPFVGDGVSAEELPCDSGHVARFVAFSAAGNP